MKRKAEPLYTRIIGGQYKGKKVTLPPKTVTRSSKSRLRESLFNTLQFDLVGKNFIEMFGGSGSVGLEALSRGAKRIWFVELDDEAFKVLQSNCDLLDRKRCDIRHGDAFVAVPMILDELKRVGEKAYLYIDPPFSIREGHEEIYDKVRNMMKSIDPDAIETLIVEHMTRVEFPETIGAFKRIKKRKFGKSSLSYYAPVDQEEQS